MLSFKLFQLVDFDDEKKSNVNSALASTNMAMNQKGFFVCYLLGGGR